MVILSAVLAVGIPLVIWRYLLRDWKPETRVAYATKYAAIALAGLTYSLGGPLARKFTGTNLPQLPTLLERVQGIFGLAILVMPIAFAIGYVVAAKRAVNSNVANSGQPSDD